MASNAEKIARFEERARQLVQEISTGRTDWPATQADFDWLAKKVTSLQCALDMRNGLRGIEATS